MASKRNRKQRWTSGRVEEHPLVRAVVEDAAAPPILTLLIGFGGRSSRRGYVRLYLGDELRRYVDIRRNAVRLAVELPATDARPWGGTAVWVGFASEDDIRRHPVLRGGEGADTISTIEDLRSLSGSISAGSATDPVVVVRADGPQGAPGGGGPNDPSGPNRPPPPPPRRRG